VCNKNGIGGFAKQAIAVIRDQDINMMMMDDFFNPGMFTEKRKDQSGHLEEKSEMG
jgi:hypothetical protein